MNTYYIECHNDQGKPVPYCKYEILIDGEIIKSGVSDNNGFIYINKDYFKNKITQIALYNEEYPKDALHRTEKLEWKPNILGVTITLPKYYDIALRNSDNKGNESATYKQSYYEVEEGDDWSSIEEKTGEKAVLLAFINNLSDEIPPSKGMRLLKVSKFNSFNSDKLEFIYVEDVAQIKNRSKKTNRPIDQ